MVCNKEDLLQSRTRGSAVEFVEGGKDRKYSQMVLIVEVVEFCLEANMYVFSSIFMGVIL